MATKTKCVDCTRNYRTADDCYDTGLCWKELKELQAKIGRLKGLLRYAYCQPIREGGDYDEAVKNVNWRLNVEQALQGKKGR